MQKNNQSAAKKASKSLPLWSKALIAYAALCMATVMSAIIFTSIVIRDMTYQSQDPVHMAAVAQTIAAFPQPLPKGYSYFCALDLAVFKVVTIDYDDGKRQQQLMMLCYPIDNPNPENQIDPSKLVKEVASNYGLNTFKVQSKFKAIDHEGCWTIQGFMIPYIVGSLENAVVMDAAARKPVERSGTGLVACLVNELGRKVILFYVVQLGSEPFDMRAITNLLQDVKGF